MIFAYIKITSVFLIRIRKKGLIAERCLMYNTVNQHQTYCLQIIIKKIIYEHGQKEEAQKFLNTYAVNIDSYDNLYKSGNGDPTVYVKKIIQGIIDQY